MKQLVSIMKALGEENRFRIVMMLRERPLCVCEVCEVLDISLSTVSTHLKQLTQAGILSSEKDGRWVIYSVSDKPSIQELIEKVGEGVKDEGQLKKDLARTREISAKSCAAFIMEKSGSGTE